MGDHIGNGVFFGSEANLQTCSQNQRKLISPKHPKIRQFVQRHYMKSESPLTGSSPMLRDEGTTQQMNKRRDLDKRTRYAFDMALRIHLKIQERDIEVGRNLGNWILRWLDRMKPEAQIRTKPPPPTNINNNVAKHSNNSSNNKGGLQKYSTRSMDRKSDRHLFTSAQNVWPKSFPTMVMMMRPMRPAGHSIQYRQYSSSGSELFSVKYGKFGFGDVIRNDIRQWIMHN
ncbi:hypothetical protein BUALT_Bualt05G0086400 [Buddleja alternifolia]|uniref:Uncharacterized protein n=1 Tax=Buddleja alternifolia TaxID=168488 RepID=A0AAV6XJ56_9LAMI|nr:hypothetical protein BUALT_Bualt05G0086400 [Buddleja alternifolia]